MANIVLAALSTGIEGGFSVIYDVPQDLWDNISQIFDRYNVNKLLWNISGDSTATVDNMAPIEALAATRMTSADMIANYNKVNPASANADLSAYANSASADAAYYSSANAASVSANPATSSEYLIPANFASADDDYSVSAMSNNAEIIVTFAGLKWTPVYLSTTNEGKDNEPHDVILTLWLTDASQLSGETYADGKTFDENGNSTWSSGFSSSDNTRVPYPSAMYGTSYMSAVVLNNGGGYITSEGATELTQAQQNASSVFAKFTMKDFGLAQYLVTPEHVLWQKEGQSTQTFIGGEDAISYNCPNENWSNDVPDDGFYVDENGDATKYNYAHKTGNDAWKDDYLWLPSLSETGYTNKYNGIWCTSENQRKNMAYSWSRTGYYSYSNYAYYFTPGGYYWRYHVESTYGVRPALHLNLTEVAKSLKK